MPYVQFVESAGADLRGEPATAIPRRRCAARLDHFAESGRLFYEITELSKLRIPTISRGVRQLDGRRRLPARA